MQDLKGLIGLVYAVLMAYTYCMRRILLIFCILLVFSGCKTQAPAPSLPDVELMEPEFEIVSIIIIQADLVNTQFETVLKIVNPNNFDLQVTSIQYELHGNGMFWAEGRAQNIVTVPSNSSAETKFRFSMNFINMNRRLLDDVIAMRQVRYAFKGQAQIQPDIPRSRVFTFDYNISGLSDVKPRSD